MEIRVIESLKEFKKFYREVYANDRNFIDNKSNLLPIVWEIILPLQKNNSKDGRSFR